MSEIQKGLINSIHIQMDALKKIIDNFPVALNELTEEIFNCSGKIVLCGIGKSGHIARKVAATLSSTGTPAIFLHPTESLHGDLGVVTKNDIVLLISKSGENSELSLMVPTLKKIDVMMVAVTGNIQSSIALVSDLVINLGEIQEICPLELAPTTSATLTLVLLDSVAMEVMRLRKFSEENFANFHPSGQLGKRLLFKVSDVMIPFSKLPVLSVDAEVKEMLHCMTEGMVGAVLVADDSQDFLGLITDNDVRKNLEKHESFFDLAVKDIMNSTPNCCLSSDNAYETLVLMRTHTPPRTLIPVVDNGKLIGLLRLESMIQRGLV